MGWELAIHDIERHNRNYEGDYITVISMRVFDPNLEVYINNATGHIIENNIYCEIKFSNYCEAVHRVVDGGGLEQD